MKLSPTAQKAIDAYGGAALWKHSKCVDAVVSVKGLAFVMKRRPFFDHARVEAAIGRPFSKLTPIGRHSDISGVLDGDSVRLENENGEIISERTNARQYFRLGRRMLYWDDLDMAYFANYAFWNYFTLPRLLMHEEIAWNEKMEGMLEARFPKTIPTHSERQEFIFDKESGRLMQHNYTADVISRHAKAAHVVAAHSEKDGLAYPRSRIVTPRNRNGMPLKRPVLIAIEVHDYTLR